MINPYQAPAISEVDLDESDSQSVASLGELAGWVAGLRMIGVGYLFVLPVIFGYLFWDENRSMPFLVLGGLLFVVIGVFRIAFLQTRFRSLLWLAAVLQLVSMIGLAGLALDMLDDGRLANGFRYLFGASMFAMLLFSQALVAIVLKTWANESGVKFTDGASDLAVIGFAISGGIVSVLSRVKVSGNLHFWLCKTVVLAILIALSVLVIAINKAMRSCLESKV